MIASKLALGVLGAALFSLTSCGGDDGIDAPTPPRGGERASFEIAPRDPSADFTPGFVKVDGLTLEDDGYAPPELRGGDAPMRLVEGRWQPIVESATPNSEPATLPPVFSAATADPNNMQDAWFSPPAIGALPSGEVFVFASFKNELGVLHWSAREGESFTPLRVGGYAVFPRRVLALAADDVWVAASVTTDHFGPDFPGCPSIIIAGQDSGMLAHFDGRRWTTLSYGAHGALADIHPRGAGKVEVVADGSYLVGTDGVWEKVPGRLADRARDAGFEIEGERVIRTRGGVREVVFTPEPPSEERTGKQVPRAVHALPNGEVWLEVQILTGQEPYVPPQTDWYAWSE